MNRRFVAPLAVAAAVAAGGVAGAALGVPSISGAQESTGDTPTTDDGSDPGHRGSGLLEAAAGALGIDAADLMSQLRDGSTIAEVATAQGVDVNTVIDAMVAQVLENSDRDEADVRERITNLVNEGFEGRGPFGFGGPGHRGFGPGFRGEGLQAAADALGIDESDLVAALRDGRTIADVAAEQGVDVNTVIEAMVAEARDRITSFVNEGPARPDADDDAGTDDAESSTGTEDAAA